MKVVLANGCFDGPGGCHAGHVSLLERAAALGDRLVVAINSDRSVRALKGPTRPLADERTRVAALLRLPFVQRVIAFDTEDDLRRLIRDLRPDVLVKGAGSGRTPGEEFAGRLVFLHLLPGISTTLLARKTCGFSDRTHPEGER